MLDQRKCWIRDNARNQSLSGIILIHSPHHPCMYTLLPRIELQEVKVSAVIALTKSAAKTHCMPAQHVAGAEVERKV